MAMMLLLKFVNTNIPLTNFLKTIPIIGFKQNYFYPQQQIAKLIAKVLVKCNWELAALSLILYFNLFVSNQAFIKTFETIYHFLMKFPILF